MSDSACTLDITFEAPPVLDITAAAPPVLDIAVAGVQGPVGPQGVPGEPGPAGDMGLQGPPGPQQIFVQSLRPVALGPWVWWQTDGTGVIIDMIVNDGA